jgi:hypothetical protein
VLLAALSWASTGATSGPASFRWFEPETTLSPDDLQRLGRGDVIVRPLPSRSGQLGVFATTQIAAQPDVFVEWVRNIGQLKHSPQVPATGRFSDPPVPGDLDRLFLDQRDLDAIRECRPADCALKVSAPEIQLLRRAADGGSDAAIHEAFRRLLFARLLAYRAGGLAAAPAPASRAAAKPTEVFAALQASSPYIPRSDVRLASWLDTPERSRIAGEVESFYYWSKEYYASGKPVVTLTHVGVTRGPLGSDAPEVAVAGKQFFATRYMNGMLTHLTLVRDPATGTRYMTYTNRAQLDMLRGLLGGMVRAIVNSRLKGDASSVLRTLRVRIESGPPPPARAE